VILGSYFDVAVVEAVVVNENVSVMDTLDVPVEVIVERMVLLAVDVFEEEEVVVAVVFAVTVAVDDCVVDCVVDGDVTSQS
jgi:hypothetical protein